MTIKSAAAALCIAATLTSPLFAQKPAPRQIPKLDHAFVIMMENHYYGQIIGNPNAPFINYYAGAGNLATNYYGVGHPSLTNYLEVVGGSNFGIINDDSPDWHNRTCVSNLELGQPANEASPTNTCPIAGVGMDAATPAVDTTNEGTPTEPIYNDPIAPAHTVGISIADQLVHAGLTWKSYQESLPPYGANKVDNSDGLVSNLTQAEPDMPKLYAVKHNPFVYFNTTQNGGDPQNNLNHVAGFERFYQDLKYSALPTYSFIAPNQCHDGHGRSSAEVGLGCSVDTNEIASGDAALHTLISSIKGSETWKHGHNAIIVVWDENDYSSLPNQVVAIVDTNYGRKGVKSNVRYNHFSLLKSLENSFGLSYLNHAADDNVKLMTDLFQ